MDEIKIAAAYIRVSTEDQVEYSPASQLEKIKEYAKRNGYILPEEYIFRDEGISGRDTKKRVEFNRMIGIAEFQKLMFYKSTKNSRPWCTFTVPLGGFRRPVSFCLMRCYSTQRQNLLRSS